MTLLQDEQEKHDSATRLKLYENNTPYRDADLLAGRTLHLLEAGKFEETEPLARQSLAIREQKMPDNWRTFHTRSMLGGSLAGQKKYAEAEPLLLSGYKGMIQREDKIPATGKENLKQALQRLVQLDQYDRPPRAGCRMEREADRVHQAEAGEQAAAPPP